MRENGCNSDPELSCPSLTLRRCWKEPEHKWARLHCPVPPSKEPESSSAFKLFSLYVRRQKETKKEKPTKEKSRRLPEKDHTLVENRAKSLCSGEYRCCCIDLILHYTCGLRQGYRQQENSLFPKGKLVFIVSKMEPHAHLHTQSRSLSFKKLVQMRGFVSLGATWPQDSAVVWKSESFSCISCSVGLTLGQPRCKCCSASAQKEWSMCGDGRKTSSEVSEVIFNQMCIFTM